MGSRGSGWPRTARPGITRWCSVPSGSSANCSVLRAHLTMSAMSLALHVANALLLWVTLRSLKVRGAYFIAFLFAVHPVHVESVAWITERKNLLSTFFSLLALIVYLRWASARHVRWYFFSLVLFLCALLSKTVAATLPGVILIVVWWKGKITAADVLALVPFAAAGLLFGAATAWIEVHHVGAVGTDWTLSPLERVLVAGRVV